MLHMGLLFKTVSHGWPKGAVALLLSCPIMGTLFKNQYTSGTVEATYIDGLILEERKKKSLNLREQFPDRIPVNYSRTAPLQVFR